MKINIKKNLILINILVLIISTTFYGCSDKTELSEISPVIGVAIDKMSGGDPIRVTVEIASPNIGRGKNSMTEKKQDSIIEVSTGKSIFDAIQNFSKISPLLMDFSHTKVAILSKSLCESGISEAIDFLNRNRQFRSTIWILAANGSSKEILESKTSGGGITSIDIDNAMLQNEKNPSILPVDLNELVIESLSQSKSSFVPVINLGKFAGSNQEIQIENEAVFKNDHLIGELSNEESKSLIWLSDKSKGHMTILPFKSDSVDKNVTVDVYKKSSQIIPHVMKDEVHFEIICTGYAVIRQIENLDLNTEAVQKIEEKTESVLKNQLHELINTSQKNYNADFVGFSKKIYNNYPQKWLTMKDKWSEIYPNIQYDINFKINITNIGMINNSPSKNKGGQ